MSAGQYNRRRSDGMSSWCAAYGHHRCRGWASPYSRRVPATDLELCTCPCHRPELPFPPPAPLELELPHPIGYGIVAGRLVAIVPVTGLEPAQVPP